MDSKEATDKLVKRQFWVRKSLYEQARALSPNHGDLSELMREGLELAIAARKLEAKLREVQLLTLKAQSYYGEK